MKGTSVSDSNPQRQAQLETLLWENGVVKGLASVRGPRSNLISSVLSIRCSSHPKLFLY